MSQGEAQDPGLLLHKLHLQLTGCRKSTMMPRSITSRPWRKQRRALARRTHMLAPHATTWQSTIASPSNGSWRGPCTMRCVLLFESWKHYRSTGKLHANLFKIPALERPHPGAIMNHGWLLDVIGCVDFCCSERNDCRAGFVCLVFVGPSGLLLGNVAEPLAFFGVATDQSQDASFSMVHYFWLQCLSRCISVQVCSSVLAPFTSCPKEIQIFTKSCILPCVANCPCLFAQPCLQGQNL